MAWSYVLAGILTESIPTTWATSAEIATPSSAGANDLVWGPSGYAGHPGTDWAGISRTPEPIGEILNAHERTLSLPLNAVHTASFRIGLENPMAVEITSRDANVLLKIYEDGNLRFVGHCITTEEVGGEDGLSLQATFADPLWRLQHRLARKLVSGGRLAHQPHVTWTETDPAVIITELLNNANLDALDIVGNADTGIRIGTVDTLPVMTVGDDPPWNYKPLSEALAEMQASGVSVDRIGAFDFAINPVEPTPDSYGLQIATLDVREKVGTARPDVVFEFGDGSRSAKAFRFTRDRQQLLNRAYAQGADPTDDTETVMGVNLTSQTNHGLFEGLVPIDVGDATLRQAWVDANVALRGEAVQRLEFTPSISAPAFGMNPTTDGDYTIGDTVRVRIKAADVERLDVEMRVYGVDITIDDEGKEEIKPKLALEL